MNEDMLYFIISSSVFINLYILLLLLNAYTHLTVEERVNLKAPLHYLTVFIPLLFGILHPIVYRLIEFVPRKMGDFYTRFVVAGAASGLIMSVVLGHIFKVYEQYFHISGSILGIHVIAFAAYLFIYATIGIWLRIQIVYGSWKDYYGSIMPVAQAALPGSSDRAAKFDELVRRSMQK